jgi:hypothetical protein
VYFVPSLNCCQGVQKFQPPNSNRVEQNVRAGLGGLIMEELIPTKRDLTF